MHKNRFLLSTPQHTNQIPYVTYLNHSLYKTKIVTIVNNCMYLQLEVQGQTKKNRLNKVIFVFKMITPKLNASRQNQ